MWTVTTPHMIVGVVTARILMSCSLTAVCLAAIGCAPRVGSLVSPSMPDPGGCYVLVYEQPEFMGAHEFINGPRKYATLTALPFRANWRRRIGSARVGLAANVTAWVREAFRGASMILGADSSFPRLSSTFSEKVESLEVACVSSSGIPGPAGALRRADP